MFTIEQANRVAMNAMGHSQYMSTITEQSRGNVHAGEDTDEQPAAASSATRATADAQVWSGVTYEGGGEESEDERAEDQMLLNPYRDLSTPRGEIEATIDDLRVQLNATLANEQWTDADEIQRTVSVLLDHTHNHGMMDSATRIQVFARIADSFRWLAQPGERHHLDTAIIERYKPFEDVCRSRT